MDTKGKLKVSQIKQEVVIINEHGCIICNFSVNQPISHIDLEQAFAARLVKCWNMHDGLIEQLADCHEQMRGAIQILKDVADICREYPNQTSSQEILALLTEWSEPKTEQS